MNLESIVPEGRELLQVPSGGYRGSQDHQAKRRPRHRRYGHSLPLRLVEHRRYEHDQPIARSQAGRKNHPPLQAQRGNDDEARRERTQDGAQRIQAEGIAHGLSELAHEPRPGLAGNWKSNPHEDRGDQHHGESSDQCSPELHALCVLENSEIQPNDELWRAGNQLRRDEARDPDQHQNYAELNTLVDLPEGERGVNPAPEPDPGEKGREHDREAVGRTPDDHADGPGPHDLEPQRRKAGDSGADEGQPERQAAQRRRLPGILRFRRDHLGLGRVATTRQVDPDRQDPDHEVGNDRHGLGRRGAQLRQENETGRRRTCRCPQGVYSIEEGQARAELAMGMNHEADEDRKRRPHEDRRQHQDAEGKGESHHVQRRRDAARAMRRAHVCVVYPLEERGERQGKDRDRDFQDPVDTQGAPQALGVTAGHEPADGKAAHEGGEHDTGRVEARPKDQREITQPDHLVDERRRAREEEEPVGEELGHCLHCGIFAQGVMPCNES